MKKRIMITAISCILLVSFTFQLKGKEKKEKAKRKFSIEVSVGLSAINPEELYYRADGIDEMVTQYADYTGASLTPDGEFKKNKLLIPLNLSVVFPLNKKLYIRGGVEYGMSITSSEKGFLMNWPPQSATELGGSESQYYSLAHKTTYIMPQIGVGYRLSDSFDIYGTLGLGFTRFTYTEDFTVLVNGAQDISTSLGYTASGTAPGIIVGAKYQFPIRRWGRKSNSSAFVKVEYMILKTGSLTGSRELGNGITVDERLDSATFYSFMWNPFGLGSFTYWDAFGTEPANSNVGVVNKMSLNLSSIRLMIGISF